MHRILFILPLIVFLLYGPAFAQQNGEITNAPICSELVNESGYAIYGSIETSRAKSPDGKELYYKSNFHLQPDEKSQICSNGPFFEGQKLTLTLRSLFPLFECKTSLGSPIAIHAKRKESGNGYDWSATCY